MAFASNALRGGGEHDWKLRPLGVSLRGGPSWADSLIVAQQSPSHRGHRLWVDQAV